MNGLVVILVVSLIGAFAQEILSPEQEEKLRQYRDSCITETGADPVVIANITNGGEVTFDDKLNCFSGCLFKKLAVFTPDGMLDEKEARAKVPTNFAKKDVDKLFEICKPQLTGKDACENGGKLMSCLINTKLF